MKEIRSEITINANVEKVWQVLNDFDGYKDWNPFVIFIGGEKRIGGKLEVKVKPPHANIMTFKPTILEYKINSELRWLGKLLIKGIFDGEHYFKIIKNSEDTTTFIHGERFSGVLVPFLANSFNNIEEGFILMNEALKKKCES